MLPKLWHFGTSLAMESSHIETVISAKNEKIKRELIEKRAIR